LAEPDVRFSLANERTFLAWERTALGMLGGGVAVLHLLDRGVMVWILGALLLAGGAASATLGWWRYREAERAIAAGEPVRPLVLAPVIAGAVILAVVAALASALV
jgi:putative membrane protein